MTAATHDSPVPFNDEQERKMRADDIRCGESVLGVVLSVVVVGVIMMTITVVLVVW